MLRRLELLHVGSPPATPGWLPTASPLDDPADPADPADSVDSVDPADPADPVDPVVAPGSRRVVGLRAKALDPGRRGVAVLAVVAILGAGGGAWYFVRAAPQAHSSMAAAASGGVETALSGAPSSSPASELPVAPFGGSGAPRGATPSGPPELVVDVVGKVTKPGVLKLPAGSRIIDAITAAGGPAPGTDLTALDLASRLIDGEEIFVGIPPPVGPAAQAGGGIVGDGGGSGAATTNGAGASAAAVVDLNTATQAELETLPGVGAVTAQRILAWRAQHGRFTSVIQLQQISGIGPAKYAGLTGRVKV